MEDPGEVSPSGLTVGSLLVNLGLGQSLTLDLAPPLTHEPGNHVMAKKHNWP